MGDRTYCALFLIGELRSEHIKTVTAAIDAQDPVDIHAGTIACTLDDAFRSPDKHSPHAPPSFGFLDMNYAAMPDTLERALTASGISWAWTHGSGDEYGEGVQFFNAAAAENERTQEYCTIDGQIALTLTEINTVDVFDKRFVLEKAIRWAQWREQATFRVID